MAIKVTVNCGSSRTVSSLCPASFGLSDKTIKVNDIQDNNFTGKSNDRDRMLPSTVAENNIQYQKCSCCILRFSQRRGNIIWTVGLSVWNHSLFSQFLKSWHYGEKFLTWQQHHIYSRQAAVALSVNINSITPCASEDFSQRSPTGYQVFRTACIKAFISWTKAGWLLFRPKTESSKKKSISKHVDY